MAKKYLSLEGLSEYDALLKTKIDDGDEAAKEYADTIKNELLNGAGEAYDTLKELGDLIDENADALQALETVANSKANADHNHDDVYETKTDAQTKFDEAKEYTDTKTSGLASTSSVETSISTHNTATDAHNDIRVLITDLYTLAEGKVDSLSDLGITATATELNYVDGVTSNIQTQLDNKINTSDLTAITTAEIDEICGSSIYAASEVEL